MYGGKPRWVAIAVCAGLAGTMGSSVAIGDQPYDRVVGGGENTPGAANPTAHFQINARSNPDGSDASGKFSFKITEGAPPTRMFTASVTCMSVAGNVATIVGIVDKTKDNDFPSGKAWRVRVEDLGQGADTQDRIQNGLYTGDPRVCPAPVQPMREPITSGNINVFDAP